MPPHRHRADPAAELRTGLALVRMDCAALLSVQVDGLLERAARRPRRAGDPDWWRVALAGPADELDDGWARRAGPLLRRAQAARTLGRLGVNVAQITHVPSRPAAEVLGSAAVGVLPPSPARSGSRAGALFPGALLSGSVLSGSALSGSLLSGAAGIGRVLPASGPGPLLVLAGLVLLGLAGAALRGRSIRAARARELALRVRAAVLAAAERELVRRTLDVERRPVTRTPVTRTPVTRTPVTRTPVTRTRVPGGRATSHAVGAGRAA